MPVLGSRPRWTLRRRLVVTVVALVAVVAAVMGTVTTLALRSSLVGQLDEKLLMAHGRANVHLQPPGSPLGGDDDRTPPGPIASGENGTTPAYQDTGTVNVYLPRGTDPASLDARNAGSRIAAGGFVRLTDEQIAELLAVPDNGVPTTVELTGMDDYRAVSTIQPNGAVSATAMPLAPVTSIVTEYVAVEGVVAAFALMVAAATGMVLVRRELRPLDRVVTTANRVARLPLDRGEVVLADRVPVADTDPATEVGQVGAALNQLLGHVEQALAARHESESQVRQFVADASHELRTPLASIRGYAELVRRSPEELPAGALQAMSRVESESVRMTGLLEDMLLLARLDAGRPLATDPVDLALLSIDALTDAHAAGPDHTWSLDLVEDATPDDVLVAGDTDRLRQVLANLLSNARLHTPAGTEVTVRLRRDASCVILEVADDGPGIPPALRDSLFQRFTRGDASRNRNTGSTGLGLAIVHAVVTAHGGTIAVGAGTRAVDRGSSMPSGARREGAVPTTGTTFTVTLPAADPPPPPRTTGSARTRTPARV
ncbi:cell wall metabolism sensor histidine kinase WalK [Cellulomonas sp. URHD0024]|uniref:sensor histidine kinase n=1 Tax=Cellulomonas sp. URHD0024 TaxID=1302620 RepID=UPI00041005D8|nr:HAMP domain-containing sensor histidine kinase [Cellulomonas sp. URHD0024]